jgi:hypothetical protein
MAIELPDYKLLLNMRKTYRDGNSCAFIGDIKFYGNIDMDLFKQETGFVTADTFDVNGNPTHKLDLNNKLPEQFHDRYDWVIDSGSTHCCFDPSTVFENILLMLKDKGCVFHTNGLAGFFGRAFYAFSPALYRDFYNVNNFTIKHMATKTRDKNSGGSGDWKSIDPNHTYLNEHGDFADYDKYIPTIPNDWLINCFAVRENRVEFKKPVPQHYVETKGK